MPKHFDTMKQQLIASIEADVEQFLEDWERNHNINPEEFPAEQDDDVWIALFWAWMEGE